MKTFEFLLPLNKLLSSDSTSAQRNECKRLFAELPDVNEFEKHINIRRFEEECSLLRHKKCMCCHSVRLTWKVNKNGVCGKCAKLKDTEYYATKQALPTWIKDGTQVYTLPEELSYLTHAEKMLIQRISPFVPLHHIKNGTFGLKGHVCAFEQDVNEFLVRLPRDKDDTTVLKVVQSIRAEMGNETAVSLKCFIVRKREVYRALEFLKEYNPLYADIEIDRNALNWIVGEEGYLEGHQIHAKKMKTRSDDTAQDTDLGPAREQALAPMENGTHIEAYGYIDEGGVGRLSEEDARRNKDLREEVGKMTNQRDIVVDWPAVKDHAVSEFGDKKIFALAFPWLFPGGVGDVKDFPGSLSDWGKMLLFYEDGRFAKDKIFCFYAMNYIVRQRNASSGNFFINNFQSNCPDTLEDLKEEIAKGNTSFVNSLTYYNRRIKGGTAYWTQKRSEVYSWMHHHVERGHGAPTFFITLSCAEYYWPDIIKLLKERMELAGEDSTHCRVGSPKLSQIVNDYAIVIQEYFQERVEIWLNTVGKDIFDIKHYWVRYEFAPGRGQIHAHLLAITGDQSIYTDCSKILEDGNGETERAERMAKWAERKFGLTASVAEGFDNREVNQENTPVQIRFTDVKGDKESVKDDIQNLMKFCATHQCSEFCLRKNQDPT